nr:hypothetical protein [Tanacetum cinerariifolium]
MTWIKLCKLDEYGNMKEVLTYELRPNVYDHTISSLCPFHLMKNENWLMLKNCWDSNNDRIYKVDLKNKRHITNKGKEKEKGNIHVDFEYANVRMDDNTNIARGNGQKIIPDGDQTCTQQKQEKHTTRKQKTRTR